MKRSFRIPAQLGRDVVFYDLLFGRFTISVTRLIRMFTDKGSQIFLCLGVLLLFAADPNNLRDAVGLGLALVIWIGAVAFYLALVFATAMLFSFLQTTLGRFPIYAPVTSSLIFLIVFFCVRALVETLVPSEPSQPWYMLFINIVCAGLAIETLFIRFVIPGIFLEPAVLRPTQEKRLQLGGRQLPLADVIYMAAQEHHVEIALPNGTIRLRGRLGDAIAQTTPDQGFQPHRSWYVAAKAEPVMTQQNGKPVLRLTDGTIVPVAKTRQTDTQGWLDRHQTLNTSTAAE